MKISELRCAYCSSINFTRLNTYKHQTVVCNDCNNVSHFKKDKYFLEYIIPRSIAKKILPHKAFLRLFSARDEFIAAEFYDTDAFDAMDKTGWRKSETQQVLDQLGLIGFVPDQKRILDVSGGPGNVGHELSLNGGDVTVTEYSSSQVASMKKHLDVDSVTFDYLSDNITEVTTGSFDLIMVRSSIIFCPNLDEFITELCGLLKPNGVILIESILPSLGEILWWQQLEYKFPFIYCQETIEKCFAKNGFTLKHGYRDYGSYSGVKLRSHVELSKHIFTWLVDYPMVVAYFLLNFFKRPAIDNSLDHKMITQFWVKNGIHNCEYINFKQGGKHKSKTFGFKYNGYLKGN